jgi:hypothetical protein
VSTPTGLDPSPEARPRPSLDDALRRFDPALRVVGGIVAVWGAAVLATLGAFLTPLRFGGVLVPVALVLAVAGPALVMWYGLETTGRRIGGILPGVVWVAVTLPALSRTTEGDLVLTQQWVAILYLFLGPIAAAVAAYRLLLPGR